MYIWSYYFVQYAVESFSIKSSSFLYFSSYTFYWSKYICCELRNDDGKIERLELELLRVARQVAEVPLVYGGIQHQSGKHHNPNIYLCNSFRK